MLKEIITLKEKINTFPKTPGIYLMKDKEGNIIYVGKSKKLQERIKSYFVNSKNHSRKIQRMVKSISDIEIINTDTELDALLLECEYIKDIRPIYNTLLKNHENYSYIKIDKSKEYPYLEVVNEAEDEGNYFGPYTKSKKLEEIKDIINEAYKLRRCKKMNKCFNYDLKKCLGPCRDEISVYEYNKIIENLISDLNGETNIIFNILTDEMNKEISNLNFEQASKVKENIDKIKSLFNKQEIINNTTDNKATLAWISLDEKDYKIYIIKRGRLIKTEVIDKVYFDKLDKNNYLSTHIDENKEDKNLNDFIDKYDIDFISIIYNYIKYDKDIKSVSIDMPK